MSWLHEDSSSHSMDHPTTPNEYSQMNAGLSRVSVGRQIPITQILPEYLTCQAYLSTVSERLHKTGTYLTCFAQVPE